MNEKHTLRDLGASEVNPTFCCCTSIGVKESLVVNCCGDRTLTHGPVVCYFNLYGCLASWYTQPKLQLMVGEFTLVENSLDPTQNRYLEGPQLVELQSGWETFTNPDAFNSPRAIALQLKQSTFQDWKKIAVQPVLGADDYLIKCDSKGHKSIVKGPIKFMPVYGDVWGKPQKCISIPVNCYVMIKDNNSANHPITHKRGPMQYFPESYEEVQVNPSKKGDVGRYADGREYHYDCFHVNDMEGIHVQCVDGSVKLVDSPQFYMPAVGETILCTVTRQLMMNTDFCIMKAPNGTVSVINGSVEASRSFMVQPFHEFVYFMGDKYGNQGQYILSTLPQFLTHEFMIRTSDNVELDIVVRIAYKIADIDLFTSNPIQFVEYMRNYVQDDFLDRFSKLNLRGFMAEFTNEALQSISHVNGFFNGFGINIEDIQILSYTPHKKPVGKMLELDIHTNVIKQNELRAVQNDVKIQEQNNEVLRKKKDLDVALMTKDNQIRLRKKELGNEIRIKEMEIQIEEEKKRAELLTVRRGNDLIEYEFQGRCRGNNLYEFMNGIDKNLSTDEKVSIWMRQMDDQQAESLYNKVPVTIVPPGAEMQVFEYKKGGGKKQGVGYTSSKSGAQFYDNLQNVYESAQDKKRHSGVGY
jgi:hypothetical protein